MGANSRGCSGVVEGLSGVEFMLTGETRVDGEHVIRAELRRMIEQRGDGSATRPGKPICWWSANLAGLPANGSMTEASA